MQWPPMTTPKSEPRLATRLLCIGLVVCCEALIGCATQMRVDSTPPGAEVLFEGRSTGKTPTVVEIPSGEIGSSVELIVRKGDLQRTIQVKRSETSWPSLGAFAAIDTGVCLALGTGGFVAGLLFAPCLFVTFAAPGACLALPIQFLLRGASVPASLSVELDPADSRKVTVGDVTSAPGRVATRY